MPDHKRIHTTYTLRGDSRITALEIYDFFWKKTIVNIALND